MKYLILGTNLSGLLDAAHLSLSDGAEVVLYDSEFPDPPQDLEAEVTVLPREWRSEYLFGVDRVVTSPWFSELVPPISDALAAGIDVITEAAFGLEHIETPFIGITGTNGKTTVTEATTQMLVASGVNALAAGNVGTAVSGLADTDLDILVLELSSYQLRFFGRSTPQAAGWLNMAPDHLDWHGTFEAYVDAKAKIFAEMAPDAVLVYNIDDPVVVAAVETAGCRLLPCSAFRVPEGGSGVEDGRIVINGDEFEATTRDPSYLFNLAVAGTLARTAGATREGVLTTIGAFTPGSHRRQVIDTTDGILWIDDSKATNPHATEAAVHAYAPVILLAGGRNKGLDLSTIGLLDGVTALVAFGESGAEIAEDSRSPSTVVRTLDEAVATARSIAREGDTVLLAPGCASFDEFSSYAERGDVFQSLVTNTAEARL